MIQSVNRQLGYIMAWGEGWQVKFAATKTQAMVISRSLNDAKQLHQQLRFGNDIISLQDNINILGRSTRGRALKDTLRQWQDRHHRRYRSYDASNIYWTLMGLTTLYKA